MPLSLWRPAENGWTGRWYSAFRVVFALYLCVHFLELLPYAPELFSREGALPSAADSPLHGLFPNVLALLDSPAAATTCVALGALLTVPFALGAKDRWAALGLWYLWACFIGRNPLIANPSLPFVGWLLLAHAFLPTAPHGSWDARGKPPSAWRMPPAIHEAAWLLMSAGYTFSGVTKLVSPSWLDGSALLRVLSSPLARPTFLRDAMLSLPEGLLVALTFVLLAFEIAFLPLSLWRRLRPALWTGMLSVHLGILLFVDFADLTLGMVMVHLFTFDPAWVTAKCSGCRRAPA